MSSQPVRIDAEILTRLRQKRNETGEGLARLAQRYIMEGMRMDEHPGICFRDGPAGRRAVVAGGPDVWEVVSALRGAPERGERRAAAVATRVGVPESTVRVALRYYAAYPEEIDAWIEANDAEADELERLLARERELLG